MGHNPPRKPSADWWVLTTANAIGSNGLTCLPKHIHLLCILNPNLKLVFVTNKIENIKNKTWNETSTMLFYRRPVIRARDRQYITEKMCLEKRWNYSYLVCYTKSFCVIDAHTMEVLDTLSTSVRRTQSFVSWATLGCTVMLLIDIR
jgi:uncharacterized membrane protein YhdT